MNRLGKLLLVATSLTPVLGAYSANALSRKEYWEATWFAGIGAGLAFVCLLILHACHKHLPREPLKVKKVMVADKQTLTFLIVYLLPMLTKDVIEFGGDMFTATYVFGIIALAVYHSNAFTFNPLLSLCGYHFYEVESQGGMTYLLLTKQIIRSQENEFSVVCISDYVFWEST